MHRYSLQKVGDEYVYTRIFEEWEDSDYEDGGDDEEFVINQEIAQLIAWIDQSEESLPIIEEVHARYHKPVGKHIAGNSSHRNEVQRFWLLEWHSAQKGGSDLRLPGYGLPLNFGINKERHPFLLGLPEEDWKSRTLMNREVFMIKLEEGITNKPHWWEKVLNADIISKWKQEALQMPWASYQHNGDFTSKMADMCFKDLATRAGIYEQTKQIPVMESSACTIESNALLSNDLMQRLRAAAALLEDVPNSQRDWHPGSDEMVLDLVHPSLWPLVFGRSRIISGKYVTLGKCPDHCDSGEIIPEPKRPDKRALSLRYQWLPCDVNLTGGRPQIKSYINNLHPVRYKAVYSLVEDLVEKSLPAWDIICRSARKEFRFKRFGTVHEVKWTCNVPEICAKMHGCYPSSRLFAQGEDYDSGNGGQKLARSNAQNP
ncbi:hypothetical protein FVEG_17734 [Fusarium verticillioides 7600]|uniref:Uncharacterized protein n=1 Tax=Gibberella moniliformis (strain M3125 / FGSC 7600) TaxID=334819 RepID=W7N7C6_GIBM7|nr:hypothetical protein FVEG_17734 [Fusarium verticillioides 7600]EWG56015.1 hypothetical protein FVEG_17734 [Fusarium verticillioides 7600]